MTDQVTSPADPGTQSLFNAPDQGTKPPATDGLSLTKEQLEQILKQNSHAQNHIKTIEDDNKKLREQLLAMSNELDNAAKIDDLLEGLANPRSSTNTSGQTAPQLDKNQLLAELKAEIFTELTNSQTVALETENLQTSIEFAKQKFGEKYQDTLRSISVELALSEEYLEALAKTSPKAFQTLVSGGKQDKMNFTPTINSFRTSPTQSDEIDLSRVARARNLRTPEGREADKLWKDAEFQRKARIQILNKMNERGSQFGNNN